MEFEPRLPQHDRNVQVVGALRSSHRRSIGRGNIGNQIQFSRVEKHADHYRAIYAALVLPQTWEAAAGDCVIEILAAPGTKAQFEAGPWPKYHIILKDAAILSAPGRAVHMYSYHTITIVGGEVEIVTAPI